MLPYQHIVLQILYSSDDCWWPLTAETKPRRLVFGTLKKTAQRLSSSFPDRFIGGASLSAVLRPRLAVQGRCA